MNPARALAPALLSGTLENLWLYWTAPLGTIVAFFVWENSSSKGHKLRIIMTSKM